MKEAELQMIIWMIKYMYDMIATPEKMILLRLDVARMVRVFGKIFLPALFEGKILILGYHPNAHRTRRTTLMAT